MKKIFIAVIALAAAFATSCSMEEGLKINAGRNGRLDVVINAANPSTRTLAEFGEDGEVTGVFWNKSDLLGVWVNEVSGAPVKFANKSADKSAATFTATIPEFEGDNASLFAVHPFALIKGVTAADGCVDMYMLENQYPAGPDAYDTDTDILLSEETLITKGDEAGEIVASMAFGRVTSLVKVAFTGEAAGVLATEKIEKMSFSADGIVLAGLANISVSDFFVNSITGGSSTVNAIYESGDVTMATPQAFFTVAPCEIPAGTPLTFTISTDAHYITKTVAASADIDLTAGRYQPFKVSLSDATVTPWSREVITNATLGLGNGVINTIVDGRGSIGSGYQGRLRGQFSSAQQNVISFSPEYDKDPVTDETIATYFPSLVCTDGSGYVKKVIVDFNGTKWTQGKTMYIYAKDTNYESALDLFDEDKCGVLADSAYYYAGTNDAFKDPNSSIRRCEFDFTRRSENYSSFGLLIKSLSFATQVIVYWMDDGKQAQTLSFPQAAYEVAYGSDFAEPEVSGAVNALSYSSSDEDVATVDPATGEVTPVGAGTTVITVRAASSATLKSGSASYELTVTDSRTPQALAFPAEAYTVALDETFTAPALSGAETDVVYSSSNEGVATVDPQTGAVTLVATGTAVITATAAGDETFQQGKTSYTLTVNPPKPRVSLTKTLKGEWIKHDGDNLYDVVIKGYYETENYDGTGTQVQWFFKAAVNGGSLTTCPNPTTRTSELGGEFSYTMTDLKAGDVVSYYAVARIGGASADNVTGSTMTITVGAETWNTLAAWEPAEAINTLPLEPNADSTIATSVLNATTNIEATMTYHFHCADTTVHPRTFKPIKVNTANKYGIYLPSCGKDDFCVFQVPVEGLSAGQSVRIQFTGVWNNFTDTPIEFRVDWSIDGENYSSPVTLTAPDTKSDKTLLQSLFVLPEPYAGEDIYARLTMLSTAGGSKSLYLGNIYVESK